MYRMENILVYFFIYIISFTVKYLTPNTMRRKIIIVMFSCFHVFMFSCSSEQEVKPEAKLMVDHML